MRRSILTWKHSISRPRNGSGTAPATDNTNVYTCHCSGHPVQVSETSHGDPAKDINTTPAADGDLKTGNIVTSSTQTTEDSGESAVHQPKEKQRKRDKVGSTVRKMLPGAGFVAGLAFAGERIWEIVENVS